VISRTFRGVGTFKNAVRPDLLCCNAPPTTGTDHSISNEKQDQWFRGIRYAFKKGDFVFQNVGFVAKNRPEGLHSLVIHIF
jgi:hypothetical protein